MMRASISGEGVVDALEQDALFAVVKRTLNAWKCWTKGGLIGKGGPNSNLDLVS